MTHPATTPLLLVLIGLLAGSTLPSPARGDGPDAAGMPALGDSSDDPAEADPTGDGQTAYWSAERLWEVSTTFQWAAAVSAEPWQALERSVALATGPLAEGGEVLGVTTLLVPDGEWRAAQERLRERRRGFEAQLREAQGFVDELGGDWERELETAARAAATAVGEANQVTPLPECSASGIQAMMGRDAGCQGRDLSDQVGAVIDADEELKARLQAVAGREWPAVGVEVAAVPATAGSSEEEAGSGAAAAPDRFVQPLKLIEAAPDGARALDLIRRHEAVEDRAIARLMGRPEGAGRDEALARRAALDEWAQDRRSELGAAVQSRFEAGARGAEPSEVGWCLQPEDLGGCEGSDVTDEIGASLMSDRRLVRALRRIADAVERETETER